MVKISSRIRLIYAETASMQISPLFTFTNINRHQFEITSLSLNLSGCNFLRFQYLFGQFKRLSVGKKHL